MRKELKDYIVMHDDMLNEFTDYTYCTAYEVVYHVQAEDPEQAAIKTAKKNIEVIDDFDRCDYTYLNWLYYGYIKDWSKKGYEGPNLRNKYASRIKVLIDAKIRKIDKSIVKDRVKEDLVYDAILEIMKEQDYFKVMHTIFSNDEIKEMFLNYDVVNYCVIPYNEFEKINSEIIKKESNKRFRKILDDYIVMPLWKLEDFINLYSSYIKILDHSYEDVANSVYHVCAENAEEAIIKVLKKDVESWEDKKICNFTYKNWILYCYYGDGVKKDYEGEGIRQKYVARIIDLIDEKESEMDKSVVDCSFDPEYAAIDEIMYEEDYVKVMHDIFTNDEIKEMAVQYSKHDFTAIPYQELEN